MTYLADGLVDGLAGTYRSLTDSYPQFPAVQNWVEFEAKYRKDLMMQRSLSCVTPGTTNAIAAIQNMIGYRFSDVRTLISALSLGTPECERLEFIGDAALDLVAAEHWIDEHPTAQRGRVTAIKSASVCNTFLGMVCIELGLHSLANSSSRQFHQGLAQVLPLHTAMLASNPKGDFWMELDYPKSLAELMEAIFGAVYVDAELNLCSFALAFKRCLLPLVQRHLSIDTVVFSLDRLLQRCTHLQFAFTAGPHVHGIPTTECTVTLGRSVLGRAIGARKQLAKRAVCRITMQRLESDPDAFAGIYICPCFAWNKVLQRAGETCFCTKT